jgi:hypothetical protein
VTPSRTEVLDKGTARAIAAYNVVGTRQFGAQSAERGRAGSCRRAKWARIYACASDFISRTGSAPVTDGLNAVRVAGQDADKLRANHLRAGKPCSASRLRWRSCAQTRGCVRGPLFPMQKIPHLRHHGRGIEAGPCPSCRIEAAAISMFGGRRVVRVRVCGREDSGRTFSRHFLLA